MRPSFKVFLTALAITALVLWLFALPDSLVVYGVRTRELRVLIEIVVLAVLSLTILYQRFLKLGKTEDTRGNSE